MRSQMSLFQGMSAPGSSTPLPAASASAPTGNSYLVTNNQLATIATRETLVPRPQ